MTDTSTNFDSDMQQITGQAAHLMWLERQLRTQRKNERAFQLAFVLMIVFDIVVTVALFTVLRETVDLPDFVIYLVIGGLVLEMALMTFFASRTSKRRKALQDEIELITRGYTQS